MAGPGRSSKKNGRAWPDRPRPSQKNAPNMTSTDVYSTYQGSYSSWNKKFKDLSRTVIMIFQVPKSTACNTNFIIKINARSRKTTDAATDANDKQLTDWQQDILLIYRMPNRVIDKAISSSRFQNYFSSNAAQNSRTFWVLSRTYPVFKHFQGPWISKTEFKHFQGFFKHYMNPDVR